MGHNKETSPKMSYSNTIGCISGHSTDIMILLNFVQHTQYLFKICRLIDKWGGADLLQSPIEWTKWCFETSSCYSSNDWKPLKPFLTYSFVNHTNAERNVCLWVKTRSTLSKCYFIALLLLFLDTEQILWYLSFQSINLVTLNIMPQ